MLDRGKITLDVKGEGQLAIENAFPRDRLPICRLRIGNAREFTKTVRESTLPLFSEKDIRCHQR